MACDWCMAEPEDFTKTEREQGYKLLPASDDDALWLCPECQIQYQKEVPIQ